MSLALQVGDEPAYGLEEWVEFLGHLHPLVLHLPIGLLAGLFAMEGAALVWKGVVPGRRLLAAMFGLSAAAAALTGWWLGEVSDFHPSLVDDHRKFGLAAAGAAVVVGLLDTFCRGRGWAVLRAVALLVSAVLFTMAGHRGGMMTHGKTFLSDTAPPWLAPFLGPAARGDAGEGGASAGAHSQAAEFQAAEFQASGQASAPGAPLGASVEGALGLGVERQGAVSVGDGAAPSDIAIVHGAFQSMCLECHCEAKAKGKLRLDLLDGWNSSIDLEDPELSELLYRVRLPVDDVDAMPPEGDRLPPEAIAALERWIHAGAPTDELSALLAGR